jgi:FMN phosphatase YigB (HAD superfamily)
MKPDAALYEIVESLTGCRNQEILYLDDRPENIATGQQRNWQVVHHQQAGDTIRLLQSWGMHQEASSSEH